MKIKLKAPQGYKYHDSVTNKEYSEIVIDEKKRSRFELMAENETIMKI